MSKKLKVAIIVAITIIAVCGFVGFAGKAKDVKKIKANPKQTIATIVEFDNLQEYNTNGCWIYYEYTVSAKKYKHCQKYHGWKKEDNYFLKRSFPLVYCAEDPDLSRLLIIEEEFKTFGLIQPDSLKKYNGRIL
ncbi:MAG: hypothetical protein H0U95_02935 [Bacteroidetes bacterium]|nr:hypothetical protein [Bacteroidota bacterium]